MPPGVLADALRGVDDQERGLGVRRPGDHVAEELDVPGRVQDDVIPRGGLEEDPGRVDGDALSLLVLEGVKQERILEWLGRPPTELADGLKLPLRQGAGIRQQPSDYRAFPVVDVAANHHAKPVPWRNHRNLSHLRKVYFLHTPLKP